jgi:putative flippase GtrA
VPTTAPQPTGAIARLVESVRGAMDVIYREMVKFGVVGALAFVIDLGLANLLWQTVLSDKVTTAKIISGAVATLFAWVGNRQWTFRHRRSRPAHHEVALFFGVNLVALGISAVTLYVSHYGLGFTTILADNVATVVGIGIGTLFRFWAYRRYVFAGEPL